ncbi:septal ring lytic transglycosylase RlpA family protein [Bartonella sp. A05]|uniref:septal ring lytic transglycosylase RlpA family protein n=1 Tax=Bartonella sp. A05 TaxID=2967261 RepID=UPI0022A9234E|nr:septal ring lytic transglycosylase RlpA family protein [Bartonella sp. A05]MCZ2204261.1 septal ring lytic transglycosylase RlpA family protein [Bartonella sp. A05]
MLLNSKDKFISFIQLKPQFIPIIIVAQLLTACGSQTTQFAVKNSKDDTIPQIENAKVTSVPENNLNKQNKSKSINGGRAVVGKPYQIKGKWYYPKDDPTYKRVGEASWYGIDFHGRLTANGEIYDMNLLTAAHPTMPLPSYARVTNLENGSSIIVRVNDRGPFMKDRIIDLSKQAATMLGYVNEGISNVEVEYISRAPVDDYDTSYLMASYVPGDYAPSVMVSEDTTERKDPVLFSELNADSQRRLIEALVSGKRLMNNTLIGLPDVGPVLVDKPVSFGQLASVR